MIYPYHSYIWGGKKSFLRNTLAVWIFVTFLHCCNKFVSKSVLPISSLWVKVEKKNNTLKFKLSGCSISNSQLVCSVVNGSITLLFSHYSAYTQCIRLFWASLASPSSSPSSSCTSLSGEFCSHEFLALSFVVLFFLMQNHQPECRGM